jgi:hypothetical protein
MNITASLAEKHSTYKNFNSRPSVCQITQAKSTPSFSFLHARSTPNSKNKKTQPKSGWVLLYFEARFLPEGLCLWLPYHSFLQGLPFPALLTRLAGSENPYFPSISL